MERITVAKSAGFCFGVSRAVKQVYELIDNGCRVATIGRLIHNPTIISELEAKGVTVIRQDDGIYDRLESLALESTVKGELYAVIRAHGVPKIIEDKLRELTERYPSFHYIDCTCPFVKKIHQIVADNSSADNYTLIIGDATHPEVIGIAGYSKGEVIVLSPSECDEVRLKKLCDKPSFTVAQTTLNINEWKNSQKNIEKCCTNTKIFDTICSVTELRQKETYELSKKVDLMLVIGGRESSNTNKLYNIAKMGISDSTPTEGAVSNLPEGRRAILIENAGELNFDLSANKKFTVGITAGASTPRGIIEEVFNTMAEKMSGEAEMNFAEMIEETLKPIKNGDEVTGVITNVTANEIHVDMQTKVTGIIPYSELGTSTIADYKVGDTVEAVVVKVNEVEGVATLSRKRIEGNLSWKKLNEAYENGETIVGKYVSVVKGGCLMAFEGNTIFVPASQTGVPATGDLNELVGTEAKIQIIEIDTSKGGHRSIGSAKRVLSAERKAKEAEFWANIEVGKEYDGVVKSLQPYGAFVDLGGVDGMVHSSELSWKRIRHPSDVVAVGDKIHVFVKSFDAETHKISLGYKTEETNPWFMFKAKYAEGDVASVKIVNIMPFGAFAEVVPGADGLIHISQIADHKIADPKEELTVGQVVDAKIIAIDEEKHKISLSIRALLNADADAEEETAEDAE